jgi:hypothetical protein
MAMATTLRVDLKHHMDLSCQTGRISESRAENYRILAKLEAEQITIQMAMIDLKNILAEAKIQLDHFRNMFVKAKVEQTKERDAQAQMGSAGTSPPPFSLPLVLTRTRFQGDR